MIVRPLELASRLRAEPRSIDWLFYVNAGLLVLFFALFGSPFVLAPGIDVQLPQVSGARAGATATTHVISVTPAGLVFIPRGPVSIEDLGKWLKEEAVKARKPSLLVRASKDVSVDVQSRIASVAAEAGFTIVWAAVEPPSGEGRGR